MDFRSASCNTNYFKKKQVNKNPMGLPKGGRDGIKRKGDKIGMEYEAWI